MLTRRVQSAVTIGVVLIIAGAHGGCANQLPGYPVVSPDASLNIIAQRLEGIHAISSRCEITLTDPHGASVQFEGALVAATQPPGHAGLGSPPHHRFRLRAWKFDRAVFDLTVITGDSWIESPPDPEVRARLTDIGSAQAQQIADAMWLLDADFLRDATSIESQSSADQLVIAGFAFDRSITCEIDRRTLTPRRFLLTEGGGQASGEIRLDEYRMINGIAWPTRLSFRSGPGAIELRLTEIELNGTLAEGAFKPPSRAVRLP